MSCSFIVTFCRACESGSFSAVSIWTCSIMNTNAGAQDPVRQDPWFSKVSRHLRRALPTAKAGEAEVAETSGVGFPRDQTLPPNNHGPSQPAYLHDSHCVPKVSKLYATIDASAWRHIRESQRTRGRSLAPIARGTSGGAKRPNELLLAFRARLKWHPSSQRAIHDSQFAVDTGVQLQSIGLNGGRRLPDCQFRQHAFNSPPTSLSSSSMWRHSIAQ